MTIQVRSKRRSRYLKELKKIKNDPVAAVAKAKRLRNLLWILSVAVVLPLIGFYPTIPFILSLVLTCVFGILATLSIFWAESILNVPLALEFIDWQKVMESEANDGA